MKKKRGPKRHLVKHVLVQDGDAAFQIGRKNTVVLCSRADLNRILPYSWSFTGTKERGVYAESLYIRPGKHVRMHHLVMDMVDGYPPGMVIDHINRNTLDNRRENLRLVPIAINAYNTHKFGPNSGTCWNINRNVWTAYIHKDGRKINLGRFQTQEEALAVRIQAEIEMFGFVKPGRRLNPVD
jgi:hypothetical protein